jgi:hypothetical protein
MKPHASTKRRKRASPPLFLKTVEILWIVSVWYRRLTGEDLGYES